MKSVLTLSKKIRGFSLSEMLAVVAVVGILAGGGYTVLNVLNKSVKEKKLNTEVATLNSAVATYLGFGGNLDDATKPEDVVAQLRSVAKSDVAKRIPGLSSSMVDPRIAAVVETEEQADSGELRVVWNDTKKKFETSTSGDGITAFFFDADDAEVERSEDNRDFDYLYSKDDTWVWDYTEVAAATVAGPSYAPTYDPITIGTNLPPITPINPTPPNPTVDPLSEPVFSMPGGSYGIREYDLGVTLTNPNPANSSEIYYQVDHGNWQRYTAGTVISVEPDMIITAQSIASNSEFRDSSRIEETFSANPVTLNPPNILPSSDSFGVFTDRLVAIVIEDTNPDDPTKIEYKIGNGNWIEYTGFLLLDRVDFENGAIVSARATSEDPYYLSSNSAVDIIGAEPLTLLGLANGEFHDPVGGTGMVTNLNAGGSSNEYFEWGRTTDQYGQYYSGTSKSWMEFDGIQANSINMGNRFQLGDLEYYNGSILADSGAESINFALDLSFNIGGVVYNTAFDYEFELINTLNTNDEWASADYVRMDRTNSATTFEVDGLNFELILEFGVSTSQGFSNFDEFHVKEEQTASSVLYATINSTTQSQGTVGADGSSTGNEVPDGTNSGTWWQDLQDWLASLEDKDSAKGKGNDDDDDD